jgi:hypothetical protein
MPNTQGHTKSKSKKTLKKITQKTITPSRECYI